MTIIGTVITDSTLTVVIDGEAFSAARNQHLEARVSELLAADEPDVDALKAALDPASRIAALTDEGVEIRGDKVYLSGRRIAAHMEKRLLDMASHGLPLTPLKLFITRVYSNPLESAQAELLLFMESGDLPLTPDGCFLAYKRVRADYTDCHSGTFDNSPGNIVQMPRHEVDAVRSNLCSTGLHFCSLDYLRNFGGDRTVIVKVDPADVVSIPSDYNNTKGRTWKYEVVGEIEQGDRYGAVEHSFESPVIDAGTVVEVPADFEDDDLALPDGFLTDEVVPEGDEPEVTGREGAFVTPPRRRVGYWVRKAVESVTG